MSAHERNDGIDGRRIPSVAHFLWLGSRFPWCNALALVSAARAGGFERVVLHHDCPLAATAWWSQLTSLPGFEARVIDEEAIATAANVDTERILSLYRLLTSPAARTDVLRTLVLLGEGGVYLDIDTITMRALDDLRTDHGFFCGLEHVCFPNWSSRSHSLPETARAYSLNALRFLMRLAPEGYRAFGAVSSWYALAANNAVIGAVAGHPLLREMVERMIAMPAPQALRRYALGPHLLQSVLESHEFHSPGQHGDVRVCPPATFFPLGPELSEHWFRSVNRPELDSAISPETLVVHWYASVHLSRKVSTFSPQYVRDHADRELFSALAQRFV